VVVVEEEEEEETATTVAMAAWCRLLPRRSTPCRRRALQWRLLSL
jgi:hypothetical protein